MSHSREGAAGLSVEEKRALLARALKDRAGSRATAPCVHKLIEEQARTQPNAIAVVCGDQALSYADLNRRANRLAHRLKALGVGPESLVGIGLNRSVDMVAALLGVLKAGGAYVPLDPAFPDTRLAMMAEDAGFGVLITEQALRETVPSGNAQLVVIDSAWESIEDESDTDPTGSAGAANLAYVIYTSGSTGRPKGVQITHGALTNFLRSLQNILGITRTDRLLAVTTLSFDIAALELFLPLMVGGRVELATRDLAADGARLAARLDAGDITMLQGTPATWRLLLEGGWQGSPSLTLLCGGEALPRSLADRLLDKGKALWNLYGPTETTIWSSAFRVQPGEGPVPIGKPIANTQLYVLDARFRPVPVGVTGELYIGGAGMARGYLRRPALTAERFLPDPFGKVPGGRLYRTGDLARWRPDGTLECLGRVDHQVKIRGFRVELGEIEAALSRHPAMREVAVAAREDATGEQALVGYLAVQGDAGPSLAELRAWLAASLPDYMVPSTFVFLSALPLTPNGKIDRNALPAPEQVGTGLPGEAYVPPRGPVEQDLAQIWGELLGRVRVGAHDSFWELGGHSILATQLLARVRDTFGVEPALRGFLDEPTVAGLARLVESELMAGAALQIPPVGRADRSGPLPASYAQQRLWFLDQLEPGSASYNIPTAARLTGNLDVPALEKALNTIVRRHEVLRTTFVSEGGEPHQVIGPMQELPLPVTDLSDLPESEREIEARRLLDEEARRPFDLSRGPLIRSRLIRLAESEHIVVVTMHHIASDGWSIGVLIQEVAALYAAFREDRRSPLPEPTLQYADFAAWQRGWLQGEALQSQLDYWTGQLSGVPNLELSGDRPRPAVLSQRGGQRSITLSAPLLDDLRKLGRKEGATLFMTLLAAFEVLLHRYTGQVDFAVGSPIAGRTRSELEGLIGFFVNTLALRADLSGDPDFRQLLRRVRAVALDAYAHQDLPFERLVGELQPDRDPSRTPIFQVMFALQNAPMPAVSSQDLEMTVLDTMSGTSKFDLTLFVTEADEGLQVTLEYRSDLFEPATIDRMLGHLRKLLEEIVAGPDQPIGALPMLTEGEHRRLLEQGGGSPLEIDSLSHDDLDSLLMDLTAHEYDADE